MGSTQGRPVLREVDRRLLSSQSGLQEQEVEERFQEFLRRHPDGKLRQADFSCMMSQALPKKDKEKLEPLIFRIYDTNGDGVVDFVELMVVLHCLQEGTPEEVLGNLFRVFDLDNDGSISRREMGRLVRDLLAIGWLKSDVATDAFKRMDQDEDGRVTREEFIRAVTEHGVLSSFLKHF